MFYSSSDESGIEDKSQISDFSMTSSKTSVTTPLSPVHEVKESPNHKMSTKNSELVDQNEIGRKGQTKSATASAFTKLTTKRHCFCEFVNSSMSSSPGQRIPQITKTIQNWLTQMEDIKARRSPFRKIKCNNGRQLGILKK